MGAAESYRPDARVCRVGSVCWSDLEALLDGYQLQLFQVSPGEPIPGSYWGEPEAGLVGHRVWVRQDTPLHSLLHETCHAICMTPDRRRELDTDAGGDDAEENAVCFLQILLADRISGFGRKRMLADMDLWGYSFRLGCARLWFEQDADDARQWLHQRALLDARGAPVAALRQSV